MILSTEAEMISYGKKLGANLKTLQSKNSSPVVINLLGDVGVGKTTLTRGIASGLGVKTPVTSPSFTISKRYSFSIASQDQSGTLIHYDFYRLPDPGLMAADLAEAVSAPHTIVIIEWGQSVEDLLPIDHQTFQISLNDDGTRSIKRTKNK